jgi:hypothetical protein
VRKDVEDMIESIGVEWKNEASLEDEKELILVLLMCTLPFVHLMTDVVKGNGVLEANATE